MDYYPFWEIRNQYNSSEYENKYKFWWKERDTESWLDYFEARYYDNGIRRFNSIDRVFWEVGYSKRGERLLLDPQQLNSYHYARNNPLVYTDKSWEIIARIANMISKSWPKLEKLWRAAQSKVSNMSVSNVWPNLVRYEKNIKKFWSDVYKYTHKNQIDINKVLDTNRVKHAFKHAEEIFWKWNNQWNKYGEKFTNIIKDSIKNPDKISKWMQWRWWDTFNRYIKKIDWNTIRVDVFTKWNNAWKLRTVTREK